MTEDHVSGTEEGPKKEGTSKKKKVAEKAANVGGVVTSYEVKSKGYQETFSSIADANNQADVLNKRGIKGRVPVDITVSAKYQDDLKPHKIRTIKIGEDFFED